MALGAVKHSTKKRRAWFTGMRSLNHNDHPREMQFSVRVWRNSKEMEQKSPSKGYRAHACPLSVKHASIRRKTPRKQWARAYSRCGTGEARGPTAAVKSALRDMIRKLK